MALSGRPLVQKALCLLVPLCVKTIFFQISGAFGRSVPASTKPWHSLADLLYKKPCACLCHCVKTIFFQTFRCLWALCLSMPKHDSLKRTSWFSTCWRWACLEESFRLPEKDTIKPYTITVPNIDRLNLDRMPGGDAQFELRKPREVDIRVWARSPGGDQEVGPFTENSAVELPSSIGSFDISMDIPPQPWVDNNAAAVVITPMFGPTPPPAPISPPLPPAPPISPNNTRRVVLSTSVLEDVESLDQLERILSRKSAAMVAALTGYQLDIPVGFRDYSVMEDCSAGSIEAMTTRLASILGVDASGVSVSCRYIGSNTVRRRRGLLQERTLLQGGLPHCKTSSTVAASAAGADAGADAANGGAAAATLPEI
ncbi:hypothetical protein DUNSADRAFT_95 [Dunaliella salina]|uniref:Encoded protein n=1 Tax=Dunaliella salina TaxID=3046 RepID=A0ABQ7H8V9_DUNSA|nr:hypothetical protein DUNSADRAFT_95 [Dunaliella salina]|eukprot:KAF5843293.1 hypothetical protein DUNSADRAFT_95 [Dunaliella salina]